jgi:transcriptional regulator GlxA family with amidase domain
MAKGDQHERAVDEVDEVDDTAERRVVFVAYDDFQLLDLAGPVDVLRVATLLGAQPGYRTVLASVDGRPVRSESGIRLAADASLAELRDDGAPIDTLVVLGGLGSRAAADDEALLDHVVALAERSRRITAVCTGAFVLAAAGLLDGYRATTHWASCDQLTRHHAQVEVLPDQIYVHDDDRWTSAGVTAGIDLFLALVQADHGRELAHAVAGWLVVFVQRPGGQAQFSAQLLAQPARTPALDELLGWLPDHLDGDLTVEALARRSGMSPRTFARAFRAETGTTPAAYVERLRIETARRLLETTGLTVDTVAKQIGLHRPETLYRAFRRRVGTTPDRYRQHFGRRAS